MILCDIGNSRMHCCEAGRVVHLSHGEGIERYGAREDLFFICVNERMRERIAKAGLPWTDLSGRRRLETAYRGLGIDREAACLGIEDGVVVDAGTAITVDVMTEGRHLGGWIWPGIRAMLESYRSISGKLSLPLNPDVSLNRLPLETRDAISFAILAPIGALVGRYAPGKRVVVTGGDAPIVAKALPDAEIDETVVFRGMKKLIKDNEC
jgi:type III pantothenate kinase